MGASVFPLSALLNLFTEGICLRLVTIRSILLSCLLLTGRSITWLSGASQGFLAGSATITALTGPGSQTLRESLIRSLVAASQAVRLVGEHSYYNRKTFCGK